MISDIQLVTNLISIQSGGLDHGFSYPVDSVMPTYFSPAFIRAWNYAMGYSGSIKVMDGDPITLFQGVSSLSLVGAPTSAATGATGSIVTALLQAVIIDDPTPQQQTVLFKMVLIGSSWFIDDIDSTQVAYDPSGNMFKIPPLYYYFNNITNYQ